MLQATIRSPAVTVTLLIPCGHFSMSSHNVFCVWTDGSELHVRQNYWLSASKKPRRVSSINTAHQKIFPATIHYRNCWMALTVALETLLYIWNLLRA